MFNTAQALLIDRYKYPQFAGEVEQPDLIAVGENPFCGDEVRLTLRLQNHNIQEIKHQCRACAVCTASTDLLAEQLVGQPLTQINHISTQEIQKLVGIPLSPLRLKCALLPLEALQLSLKTSSN